MMNTLKLTRRVIAMLCIAVIFCSGCKKDKQRTYDLLPPEPEDVTSNASLSVNYENSDGRTANEGSLKVIDNNTETKFLIDPYNEALYIQLKFLKPQHVTSYTLTSGNDAPGRDPKDWKIAASDDGINWVDLDTRAGEMFSDRGQTKNYEMTNPKAYLFYRLYITANNGDELFQMAEWRVTAVPLND
jgi:hypothetical protein